MRISPTNKPQIFLTMGDPSGIGPEIIAKAMASSSVRELAIFVIVGDAGIMERASRAPYNGEFAVHPFTEEKKEISLKEGLMNIIDPGPVLKGTQPGKPTDEGSKKALECIETSVNLIRESANSVPKAMVTAPVCKERIARVCEGFIGHTEYLSTECEKSLAFPTMVMIGKALRVVPVTRHIPIKDVSSSLNIDLIEKTLVQVSRNRALICGSEDVRIGVCALNPHCGEGGRIGREEIDMIVPAIEQAKRFYERIEGPISADTCFYKAIRNQIDIVVSMYHDQGLGPFKMVDFSCGVNMTLGLPYVRTSPDHGTAFDIAGKGIASSESMEEAIKLAARAITFSM